MNKTLRNIVLFVLIVDFFIAAAVAKPHKVKCPIDSDLPVNMPISLATGIVKTPAFKVKHKFYTIEIRAQWNLPTDELQCKMGFEMSPGYPVCHSEPLIDAEWSVWDGNQIVAQGKDKGKSPAFEGGPCYFGRFLGGFMGRSKHTYVVKVKFIKDASYLNVTDPHLVVWHVSESGFW